MTLKQLYIYCLNFTTSTSIILISNEGKEICTVQSIYNLLLYHPKYMRYDICWFQFDVKENKIKIQLTN